MSRFGPERRRAVLAAAFALLLCAGSAAAAARAPAPLPPAPPRPGAEAGPTRVFVGAQFADITRIDSASQTFSANVALVLRWRDPTLAHRDARTRTHALADVWHPRWLVANEGESLRRSLPETVDVAPDGTVVHRQRLVGTFSQSLDLRRFPFDHETFRVHLVLLGHRPEEIEFAPDPVAVAAGVPEAIGIAGALTLQDWEITSVGARARPYAVASGVELAGYALEFSASRRVQHYILKVLLPLLLIVLMSWAVFWIDPSQTAPQASVAVTSMLTLIAHRFAVGADVPKLPYLTLLDELILAGTLLVFFSIVEVLATTTLAARGRAATAHAIDRRARWAFPLAFVLATGWIGWR
jgi:hypothetical protein